ncbi:hypothetical protein, partial [Pseudonocardia dioxanivorans]|uniref:hypothetical protein n=1 Tax=Pseudonocardia dioxanivorans TaxID=240495 RepID=UPI0018F89620
MDERENDPTRPVREHHAGHELHPFRMTGGTLGRNVPSRPPAHLAASRSDLLTAPAPPAPTWAPPTTSHTTENSAHAASSSQYPASS